MIDTLEDLGIPESEINWTNLGVGDGFEDEFTEAFMEKYKDKLYWVGLCMFQTMSEEFIERHLDLVYWPFISMYQAISEDFVLRHLDSMYWSEFADNKSVPKEVRAKFAEYSDI